MTLRVRWQRGARIGWGYSSWPEYGCVQPGSDRRCRPFASWRPVRLGNPVPRSCAPVAIGDCPWLPSMPARSPVKGCRAYSYDYAFDVVGLYFRLCADLAQLSCCSFSTCCCARILFADWFMPGYAYCGSRIDVSMTNVFMVGGGPPPPPLVSLGVRVLVLECGSCIVCVVARRRRQGLGCRLVPPGENRVPTGVMVTDAFTICGWVSFRPLGADNLVGGFFGCGSPSVRRRAQLPFVRPIP